MTTLHTGTCEGCGFTTSNRHASYVDRALRVHSCEKWKAKRAGEQRRAEKLAAIDRTPKPCNHLVADHQHGTRACYVLDRCRCEPCTLANRTATAERVRQKAYGRYDRYAPAEESQAHVRELMSQGMGLKRIQAASGVAQGVLWKLVYGKRQADGSQQVSRRITRQNHDRLMAVTLDLAGGAQVDGTGTRRRLQALVAIGYSMSDLGRRLELTNPHLVVHGPGNVTKATADRVRELYDSLAMTPAHRDSSKYDRIAVVRARKYARANGWPPPLAWDDELIDDPTHRPEVDGEDRHYDEAVVVRRLNGDRTVPMTRADRIETVRRARNRGWTHRQIKRTTGIDKVERYIEPETRAAS